MTMNKTAMRMAVRQGGVIRHNQALECGLSRSSIDRRVRSGEWKRIGRGIFRLVDLNEPLDRVRAAVCVLPGAVISHETAAEMHQIRGLERGLAVVTVPTKTTHAFTGVNVHRTHDLADDHIAPMSGLPVTTPARTLCDLAATLHPLYLASIVDDQIAAKRLDFDDFRRVVESIRRKGKPGAASLGEILDERTDGPTPGATRIERIGLRVLIDAGLPSPEIEFAAPWDRTRRLDAAYPTARIGIEWDSKRWHTQVARFDSDRKRDRLALLCGWRVFRFTWADVNDRPHEVADTLQAALIDQPLPIPAGG